MLYNKRSDNEMRREGNGINIKGGYISIFQ